MLVRRTQLEPPRRLVEQRVDGIREGTHRVRDRAGRRAAAASPLTAEVDAAEAAGGRGQGADRARPQAAAGAARAARRVVSSAMDWAGATTPARRPATSGIWLRPCSCRWRRRWRMRSRSGPASVRSTWPAAPACSPARCLPQRVRRARHRPGSGRGHARPWRARGRRLEGDAPIDYVQGPPRAAVRRRGVHRRHLPAGPAVLPGPGRGAARVSPRARAGRPAGDRLLDAICRTRPGGTP